jgi:hypothetical protein
MLGRRLLSVCCAIAVAVIVGCATYQPRPLAEVPFGGRIQTAERSGLRVSVAVLSRDEAQDVFGVDLYAEGIQPVWVRIENDTEKHWAFMLHGLDPNYFSAREAAYRSHLFLRPGTNRKIDRHFSRLGINPIVPRMGETSGFAFSHAKLGHREVRIRLFTAKQIEDFEFYLMVPGFVSDAYNLSWEEYGARTDAVDLESEDDLLAMLRDLPCCTTRRNGSGKGDPLNLVIIMSPNAMTAFIRAGWDETELLTWSSSWKTFVAFFGGRYRYSPMSALYYAGRPQTLSGQKARDTIHERNHLRLWITHWRYKGDYVFVGTITRDIGVYFTTRAWNLTTHAIDPDVDEARQYLLEDLVSARGVERVGLVEGIGAATPDDPHRNLMNAPWWTDGRRAVIQLAQPDEKIPPENVAFFGFFEFGGYARAFRGKALGVGSSPPIPEPTPDTGSAGDAERNGDATEKP